MIADIPIPGSFLRGGVSKDYVTISSPATRVIMLVRDAHALMHWLYDVLPAPTDERADSVSDLWLRRRMSA